MRPLEVCKDLRDELLNLCRIEDPDTSTRLNVMLIQSALSKIDEWWTGKLCLELSQGLTLTPSLQKAPGLHMRFQQAYPQAGGSRLKYVYLPNPAHTGILSKTRSL